MRSLQTSNSAIQIYEARTTEQVFQNLLDAEVVLLVDVSSSMEMMDAGEAGNQERWQVMSDVVKQLAASMKSKLAVVAFWDEYELVAEFMPEPQGNTDIAKVLNFVAPISGSVKKIVIVSDGEPTMPYGGAEQAALKAAKTIRCQLDGVYVGPKGGKGETFLKRLVGGHVAGGSYSYMTLADPASLLKSMTDLLLEAPK